MLIVWSCGQGKKYHDNDLKGANQAVSEKVQAILDYQEERNEEFINPETSPLPDRYRKNFEGLNFFPADTNYVVTAIFERTPDAKPFQMPSTTDERTWEIVYGKVYFELNGTSHELEVYQGLNYETARVSKIICFCPFWT